MAEANSKIPNLQDMSTPFGVPLSGVYKRSYAYVSIKDRMPVILTKVIDTMCKNKDKIISRFGHLGDSANDIKNVIGFISQLKNEIVTNKILKPMRLNPEKRNDGEEWNKYLENKTHEEGKIPTWFNTTWLYCEGYMYRVLEQEISLTNSLKGYDPFGEVKYDAFLSSVESIRIVSKYLVEVFNSVQNEDLYDEERRKSDFFKLLKLTLWSNRCDLSASAGSLQEHTDNPLNLIHTLDENILINDSEFVWNILREKTNKNIHMVVDNAGFELFCDLCLGAFLIAILPPTEITFHVKAHPWYVSDAKLRDLERILEYMNSDFDSHVKMLGERFEALFHNKGFYIKEELYWTGPYDFSQMKEKNEELYTLLSHTGLVIFKGDLNYRKLLSDINFEYNTSFATALRDFRPTNILSLRTIKCDICVGLPQGMAESLFAKDENWLITGEYGLIQFAASSEVSKES